MMEIQSVIIKRHLRLIGFVKETINARSNCHPDSTRRDLDHVRNEF